MTAAPRTRRHLLGRRAGLAASAALVLAVSLTACGGGAEPAAEAPTTSAEPSGSAAPEAPSESAAPETPSTGEDEGDQAQRQVIPLPDGFQPEGITTTDGTAYVGSLADGQVLSVDLGTAATTPLGEADGTPSVGLDVADDRLWVSGGEDGDLRVLDTASGDELAAYQLAPRGEAFVNDVVVGDTAAYVTDSNSPRIFVAPLAAGELPTAADVVELGLTGDWEQGDGFGANGIVTAAEEGAVLVVNSGTGTLYRVDTGTGDATAVEVTRDGEPYALTNGDGMLRDGRTLYVVRNRDDLVAVLELDASGTSAEVRDELSSPELDVPTTVALAGGALYLPNARFGTEDPANATYQVVLVPQP